MPGRGGNREMMVTDLSMLEVLEHWIDRRMASLERRKIHGIVIECVTGDIADQPDMDAVVNAANAALRIGGGVAGAIHRAAGPELEQECESLAPISPGEAVITGAHDLPNRYVIHCLGPVYGRDEPADELLAQCYRRAVRLADEKDLQSIAFPAISTGAFGYPSDLAAPIAVRTVAQEASSLASLRRVRFVLYSAAAQTLHEKALDDLDDLDG